MIGLKILSTTAVVALVLAMAPAPSFAQNHVAGGGGARAAGGFHGGGAGYRGGGYGHRGGGGVVPGLIAGAVIGGALASGAYYGGPGYYAPGYYDDQYANGPVAVVQDPGGGDGSVAYCMQTYRSYDPQSGTYVGYDGLRHPCP